MNDNRISVNVDVVKNQAEARIVFYDDGGGYVAKLFITAGGEVDFEGNVKEGAKIFANELQRVRRQLLNPHAKVEETSCQEPE